MVVVEASSGGSTPRGSPVRAISPRSSPRGIRAGVSLLFSRGKPTRCWRRRPMALLTAAIGLYLLLSHEPSSSSRNNSHSQISVQDDGGSSKDEGQDELLRRNRRVRERDFDQQQQLQQQGTTATDAKKLTSKPTQRPTQRPTRLRTQRPTRILTKSPSKKRVAAQRRKPSRSPTRKPTKRKEEKRASIKKKDDDDVKKKHIAQPASRDTSNEKQKKLPSPQFHMVFTTGSTTLSTLNVRSIESVFYSNPGAWLHIHQPKRFTKRIDDEDIASSIRRRAYEKRNTTKEKNKQTGRELDGTHPRLAPLIEYGYNITFHRYDPAVLLAEATMASRGTEMEVDAKAAKAFIKLIPKYRTEPYWYSNESNLLRLALLYVQGGTYMDTDVILLRPYDGAFAGGGGNPAITEPLPSDGAVMAPENNVVPFPKPLHPFIAAALNIFLVNYNGTVWGNNGPRVIKSTVWGWQDLACDGLVKVEVLAKWRKEKEDFESTKRRRLQTKVSINGGGKQLASSSRDKRCVTILDKKVIQPIGWRKWFDYCISKKSPTGQKAEKLLERAYAAHLNNKLTGGLFERGDDVYVKGSVCDLLMSKYCKVCP